MVVCKRGALQALSCLLDSIELLLTEAGGFAEVLACKHYRRGQFLGLSLKKQVSGKILLQCLMGPTAYISCYHPAVRNVLRLYRRVAPATQKHKRDSGEYPEQVKHLLERQSRNGTASPPGRGVCASALCCSQPHCTCQEGHNPSTLLDCSFDAEKPQPRTSQINVTKGPQSVLPKNFSPCAWAGAFGQGSTCDQGVGLGLRLDWGRNKAGASHWTGAAKELLKEGGGCKKSV